MNKRFKNRLKRIEKKIDINQDNDDNLRIVISNDPDLRGAYINGVKVKHVPKRYFKEPIKIKVNRIKAKD